MLFTWEMPFTYVFNSIICIKQWKMIHITVLLCCMFGYTCFLVIHSSRVLGKISQNSGDQHACMHIHKK